jgi:uncharacterized protein YcbX
MPDSSVRKTDTTYSPNGQTAFADGFPFLLASKESLGALNEKLDVPVEMRNFRPNIVVEGCSPYEEDVWHEISINSLRMKLVKPCARCKIPTVNPDTGTMDPNNQPSRSMKTFRSGAAIGLENKKWAVECINTILLTLYDTYSLKVQYSETN